MGAGPVLGLPLAPVVLLLLAGEGGYVRRGGGGAHPAKRVSTVSKTTLVDKLLTCIMPFRQFRVPVHAHGITVHRPEKIGKHCS